MNQGHSGELPFEAAVAQLEEIILGLESGELPLADSLQRFEEGVALSRRCLQMLSAAEGRLQQLTEADALSVTLPE